MSIEALIIQALSGLSTGMMIFLIAVGLCLIFGTVRVLNMAHGSMYMLGAFLCFWLTSILSNIAGSFWWTVILAPLGVALFGLVVEVVLFRRLYPREMIYQLILTFGVILLVSDTCKLLWGVEFHLVAYPRPLNKAVNILGMLFPTYNIFLIIIGVLIFVGLWALMRYTRLGRIIRAVTYNREMVSALGVNVPLTYSFVFVLACWLAGLGGVLTAPVSAITLGIDATILIECFIIAVIGGLGSLPGAFVGAIIFGLVNSFGILIAPRLAICFNFILMAVVLIIRPWGLMGKPE